MSIVTSVLGRALSSSHVSWIELSTSPQTRRSQVARSTSGTLPAWSTGHFSVRYCPGGSRAGSYPFSSSFFSALERNIATTLTAMTPTPFPAARRPRDYVRVSGRDAEDFLQRMLSNDVTQAHCQALLLTPKARVIAPLVVMRRGPNDFLLLTEPGLGDTVRTTRYGREIDDRVLPAEAGLVERAVSFTKGCYPGQEPIARLQYRGHANRGLRALVLEGEELPERDAEVRDGERAVGRVTSAARRPDGGVVALAYVRREIPEDADLTVGERAATQLHL